MGKKLTQEEFIRRAKEVHGDKYDYSKTVYVNKRTNVIITCPIHGDFLQNPYNHISQKQGCPECGKEYAREYNRQTKSNTLEGFLEEAKKIHGDTLDFSLITHYENNKQKIEVICKRCGRHFTTTPNSILNGHGCTHCNKKKFYRGKELKVLLESAFGLQYSYNLIDNNKEYDKDDAITLVCKKHGEFTKKVKWLLQGWGCPECSKEKLVKTKTKSWESAEVEIRQLCGNALTYYKDSYVGANKPMMFKCNTCGCKFERTLNTLRYYHTCPRCTKQQISQERTKTTEEFIEQAKKIYGDAYDYSETEYVASDKKVRVKCNECGRYFEVEANSHLQGHGCPYHYTQKSKLEEELLEFIKTLTNEEIIENYRGIKEIKELDVYVPSLNLAFELNGLYWHNELNKSKNYHLEKTIACEKAGIHLMHIFEDEWLYKQEIIKSMLRNMFHKTATSIMARKCEIREVSSHDASDFLDNNHLQGKCGSSIRYGLFHNNELVSLMTFGKSRHFVGNGKSQWELLRFCNKINTNVIGGASKLFKHFVNNNVVNEIISYADRRWSNGNLYEKLNFSLYNQSKPNYYYVIGDRRVYRFNLRKSILMEKYGCPKEMSEREFCKQQKWYRIYDCGCHCYRWQKNLA